MALFSGQPQQRTQYFCLDEQDALLPDTRPEGVLDVVPEHGQEPVLPAARCFATAVAAAVAVAAASEDAGRATAQGFLEDLCDDSCQYLTPRDCEFAKVNTGRARPTLPISQASQDCFFTPQNVGTPCAAAYTLENPFTDAASPERMSSNSRRAFGKGISGPGWISMNGIPADGSLLVKNRDADSQEDQTAWCGWHLQATPSGSYYFCHPASGARQMDIPAELTELFGEWREVTNAETPYWSNDQIGASCWKDPRQCASIHQAALDGNLAYIQLYLFASGSIHVTNFKGRSALHNACAAGQAEVIAFLLSMQADVHLSDQSFSTPLHWACRYGHTSAVQLLLQADADVDASNMLGDTPSHEAAGLGQVKVLGRLIEAGANLHLQNAELRKPSEVAALRGWPEAQGLLEHFERCHHPMWSDAGDMETEQTEHREQRHWPSSSTQELQPLSPALKIVRAARPVLRGVQWLANRVLGELPAGLKSRDSQRQPDDCAPDSSEESEDSWQLPGPWASKLGRRNSETFEFAA